MSTALEKFRGKLSENLQSQIGPPSTEVYGVLFEALITQLIDLALSTLSSCLKTNDPVRLARAVTSPGITQEYVLRRAVRKSDIPASQHGISQKALLQTMKATSVEDAEEAIKELQQNDVDWSLF